MEELNNKLQRLLERRLEWTREEKLWLLEYLESSDTGELKALLEEDYSRRPLPGQQLDPVLSEEMLHRLHQNIDVDVPASRSRLVRLRRMSLAAASIIGLLVIGTMWLRNKEQQQTAKIQPVRTQGSSAAAEDVRPGGNKALLKLADGSTIALGDAKNGTLAQQGSTSIHKSDGRIAYEAGKDPSEEVLFNTIVTPRGGQYEVELPDGSKVWLNAASSIKFPTVFKGKDRRVEITGEAYFEVVHQPNKPFFVKVGSSEVQVLGTDFDIMAYMEETSVRTTLLQGSVRFVNGNNASLLVPGQQSRLTREGRLKVDDKVNIDEAIAWKNGLFHFENADIGSVMRQLSRWYDVDVSYKDRLTTNLFYADIPRTTNLSDALKALALTGKVHFEIKGKNILVEE